MPLGEASSRASGSSFNSDTAEIVEAKSTIPRGDRGAPADTEGSGTRYIIRLG